MLAYRITTAKYSKKLTASGAANRWNKEGDFVIYAATSRSLASLELIVHRTAIKPRQKYKVLVIDIEINKKLTKVINVSDLPKNWRSVSAYNKLQNIGTNWYEENRKLMMLIPSAVIPKENNIVLNTQHALFRAQVKIIDIENYFWDERLL